MITRRARLDTAGGSAAKQRPHGWYARDVRGRSPIFWILLTLVVGGIGLALDKGFADNTPPYDEPPIALIGFWLFFLCGFVFVVLCTVALIRLARGSASVAVTPAVTGRSLGAAIVLALVVFAVTQVWYWEDTNVSDSVNTLLFLLSVASAIALLVLAARVSRHRREPPQAAQSVSADSSRWPPPSGG